MEREEDLYSLHPQSRAQLQCANQMREQKPSSQIHVLIHRLTQQPAGMPHRDSAAPHLRQ